MKSVVVIGAGISGMSLAVDCAQQGIKVILISPSPSERAQSVMAMGGINAVTSFCEKGDSVESHVSDTIKGGSYLAGKKAVTGMCSHAGDIIDYLKEIGTVFSVDDNGRPARRAFGGQSYNRTYYCGAATGKLIVTALIMEVRRYEAEGLIERWLNYHFYSALIRDGRCYGAVLYNTKTNETETVYADALVMASGGLSTPFGKTTGMSQGGSYASGRLFLQGVELKNLEFIQYHPTTIETSQKKMLISEAVRGEGGRLFYYEDGKRVYFMEDKYGPRGNLQTRDVVAREMYLSGKEIFLDISFLDQKTIMERLSEVYDVCIKYRGLDITKEPVPVTPCPHFFMGGIAVKNNHETSIRNLFAVGEAASIYHGANRLGGNSLLAALYSGKVAAKEIAARESSGKRPDFRKELLEAKALLKNLGSIASAFPVMYIRDMVAEVMRKDLGIVRDEKGLAEGVKSLDYYLEAAEKIQFDNSVPAFDNYSLTGIIQLAKAVMESALFRKESRGAHFRSDYPEQDDECCHATIIRFDDGTNRIRYDREKEYES